MADTPYSDEPSDTPKEGEASESDAKRKEKLVEEAKARFQLGLEAARKRRELHEEDTAFVAGDQWNDAEAEKRKLENRPCLTVNRLPQFVQQITNDQRQNSPSIKVHPVDDRADIKTAEVRQGLIRNIEYTSKAPIAYTTALACAARGGFGAFRILTAFVSPLSFEQQILIKTVLDPLSVILDPHSKELDGSDANWGFVFERIAKEDFESQFPEAELSADGAWADFETRTPEWVSSDSVLVAEYLYKHFLPVELILMPDGPVAKLPAASEDELKALLVRLQAEGISPLAADAKLDPQFILKKRTAQFPIVKWCKLNGCEILEETVVPGSFIPIIPVYGNFFIKDGELVTEGIARHAKDPQRMLNHWKSAETETIGMAPKSPWLAAEGQIEGYEDIWETANTQTHSVLPYKPISIDGVAVPPPQRNAFEPPVQAITQAALYASEDMKATTGMYDGAMGARSNETSGKAILARTSQAQTSNFHFADNLSWSIKHAGRIINEIIPFIYDTARVERILGDEDKERVVRLNEPYQDPETGEMVEYRMDVGRYDVTVDVGPSFASRRQEAAAQLVEISKTNPKVMEIAGDLIVENMDVRGSKDIAERLKKTLPPGIAEDKNQKAIPPQAQAQIAQMGQMIEALQTELKAASDPLVLKRMEIESRERIEMKKLEVQLELKRAELDQAASLAVLEGEIAELQRRQELVNMSQPVEGSASGPEEFAQPPMAPEGAFVGEDAMPPTGGEAPGTPMGDPL